MAQDFDPNKDINDWTIKEIEDYLKLPITNNKHVYGECEHFQVMLDDENKTVICKHCKKELDAFWYLQLLAKEWNRRRYQDFEAIKAYRKLKEQEKNAQARKGNGLSYIRPNEGMGQIVWDSYESLSGHPPEYVYHNARYWYVGYADGVTSFELIQQILARKNDDFRMTKEDFINKYSNSLKGLSTYQFNLIYDEGFKNGRNYKG